MKKHINNFKSRAKEDGNWENRSNFRDNYAEFENYCHTNYGKGNFLDWASEKFEIFEPNRSLVSELVQMETIKSHNNNFDVSPTIEDATNLLRQILLDPTIKSNYKKGPNRATFELIALIRHNLNHQNKSELEDKQYVRNSKIVLNANKIFNVLMEQIQNETK